MMSEAIFSTLERDLHCKWIKNANNPLGKIIADEYHVKGPDDLIKLQLNRSTRLKTLIACLSIILALTYALNLESQYAGTERKFPFHHFEISQWQI